MIDVHSETWAAISAEAGAAQSKAIVQLCVERDPIIAAELRGKIDAMGAILLLGTPIADEAPQVSRKPETDSSGY